MNNFWISQKAMATRQTEKQETNHEQLGCLYLAEIDICLYWQ